MQSKSPSPPLRRWLRRAALALFSGVLALVALEWAIRTWIPVRNVGPTFTRYDAELGKRLKPDLAALRITPEFTMRLTTNSLGWRGPPFAARSAGSVVCLGDSFTLGYGVDDGQEYPRVLQGHLDQALGDGAPAVVNLGIGASGNGRWLKLIERGEIEHFDPRLAVLQVCSNDWDDNRTECLYALRADGSLEALAVPPPRWTRRVQELIEAVPLADDTWTVGLLRQCFERTPAPPPEVPAEAAAPAADEPDLTLALIEASIAACRSRGWGVVLVAADLEGAQLERLRALASRLEVRLFAAPTPKERQDLYYRVDRHWNAQGHAEVGATLAEWILGSELLQAAVGGTRG